jgi:hypothetical protein
MASLINSDNGVSSGSAGLKSSADNSGVLQLQTNGTAAVTVDTSQNVGIGTSSPATKVHALATSATAVAYRAGNSVSYAEFQVDASGNSQLIAPGGVQIFNTNGAERMRINSSGNVGINTTSPVSKLDVIGTAGITTFTGTTPMAITAQGATSTNDYSGIDFTQNGNPPRARIASYFGGGGSYLQFGTSNSYGSGITNIAASIDPNANFAFNSGYGSAATAYGCRAWVNFDGTASGTISPRASGNVTSITKNATGDYTVNITNAMPDANYATLITSSSGLPTNWAATIAANASQSAVVAPTTSAIRFGTRNAGNVATDFAYLNVAIFR